VLLKSETSQLCIFAVQVFTDLEMANNSKVLTKIIQFNLETFDCDKMIKFNLETFIHLKAQVHTQDVINVRVVNDDTYD
jgi:hypothetical protein